MSQLSITVAFSLRAKWHFISAALLIKKSGCITETSSVWLQCFVPVVWERAICCFVFFQLDPENTGFIAVENFTSLVEHHELQLDPSKLDMLLALVQSNEEGQVCYQELIELVSEKTRCTHIHTHSYHTYNAAEGVAWDIPCPAAQRQISTRTPTFAGFQKRLQNWFRQSQQAPQWRKLTWAFRSLSCKKRINLSS